GFFFRRRRSRFGIQLGRRILHLRSLESSLGSLQTSLRISDMDSFSFSSRTSSSQVCFNSFEAFLNSASPLPNDLPSSCSLRGPKIMRAKTKMTIISCIPREPIRNLAKFKPSLVEGIRVVKLRSDLTDLRPQGSDLRPQTGIV